MEKMIKYTGIDERQIKCCCGLIDCRQSGISFEEDNILRFHFLDRDGVGNIGQITRSMYLNKQTAKELIDELKKIK